MIKVGLKNKLQTHVKNLIYLFPFKEFDFDSVASL